jgi:hypothetical protein
MLSIVEWTSSNVGDKLRVLIQAYNHYGWGPVALSNNASNVTIKQ